MHLGKLYLLIKYNIIIIFCAVSIYIFFIFLLYRAQLQYITLASTCKKPSDAQQMDLLKPTSSQISAIQDFREKHRTSTFFNHLSAISESIPALGWVCVVSTIYIHIIYIHSP